MMFLIGRKRISPPKEMWPPLATFRAVAQVTTFKYYYVQSGGQVGPRESNVTQKKHSKTYEGFRDVFSFSLFTYGIG